MADTTKLTWYHVVAGLFLIAVLVIMTAAVNVSNQQAKKNATTTMLSNNNRSQYLKAHLLRTPGSPTFKAAVSTNSEVSTSTTMLSNITGNRTFRHHDNDHLHIPGSVTTVTITSALSINPEEVSTDATMLSNITRNRTFLHHDTAHLRRPDQVECVELKTLRYISDGSCASGQPVEDIICTSTCFMLHTMPEAILRSLPKSLHQQPQLEEWHCKKAATRRQKVKLVCKDGTHRIYKIQLVTKCECERKHLTSRKIMSKQEMEMFRRFQGRIPLN